MSAFDDLESRWRDLQAAEHEQSRLSGEGYRELSRIVAELMGESTGPVGVSPDVIAKAAVDRLERPDLEAIVADWLEGRGNVGSL
jgi:hypothetical protein